MKLVTMRSAQVLSLPLLLLGCGDPAGPDHLHVHIEFQAAVNGAAFACGNSYANVGTRATTITPTDFRFYVHDVRLVSATGADVPVELEQNAWQLDDLVLLDFENASGPCTGGTSAMNTTIHGEVPAGTYRGIKFKLGVPFSKNHQDQTIAPSPLNLSALFWAWNSGYKFARIDHTSSAQPGGWNVHLGSTGCVPTGSPTTPATSCANPNRPEIVLASFDFETNVIVADYGRLLAGSDVTVNASGTAAGCMSFPGDADCPPVMNRFGLDYGTSASTGQTFFSVR